MRDLFSKGVEENGQPYTNMREHSLLKKIPNHWKSFKFKDICDVSQGLQIAISERFSNPAKNRYVYLTIQYLNSQNPYLDAEYIENPPASVICHKVDLLMTRTGNTGQVITNQEGVFHKNFFVVKYNKNKLVKDFVKYYLMKEEIQTLILHLAGTTTIPDLKHKDFLNLPIVFPESKEEQERISKRLNSIDTKIESEENNLNKLLKMKTGLMQDLLTGKVRVKVAA